MKIKACVIFYNDGPELLRACLESLRNQVDQILCIDGAYKDFPHKEPYSTDGCLQIAKELADEVIECSTPWENQIVKRNAYLTASKSFKGYLLIIDADEMIQGSFPNAGSCPEYSIELKAEAYTLNQIRLIKNRKGLEYRDKHCFLYDNERLINQSEFNPEARQLKDLCILHNFHLRSPERLHTDGEYLRNRIEAERPAVFPKLENLVNLQYIGTSPYSGFDGSNTLTAFSGQAVKVSPEKAEQLLSDFPTDWRK